MNSSSFDNPAQEQLADGTLSVAGPHDEARSARRDLNPQAKPSTLNPNAFTLLKPRPSTLNPRP